MLNKFNEFDHELIWTQLDSIRHLIQEFQEVHSTEFFINIKVRIHEQLLELLNATKFLISDKSLGAEDFLDVLLKTVNGFKDIFRLVDTYTCFQSTFFSEFKVFINETVSDLPHSTIQTIYLELSSIIYKLHTKYFTRASYDKTEMLNFYTFFLSNFAVYYNRLHKESQNISVTPFVEEVDIARLFYKDKQANLFKANLFSKSCFLDSSSFYLNFTNSAINNYYNQKVNSWKSQLLNEFSFEKCRICEEKISISSLVNHSIICLEKRSLRSKLKGMNVDLERIKEDANNLVL